MRTCSQCGVLKESKDYHKEKRAPDGCTATCKECFNLNSRNTKKQTCRACGEFKSRTLFHKDMMKANGYRTICKSCQADYERRRIADRAAGILPEVKEKTFTDTLQIKLNKLWPAFGAFEHE